jgi:hypothetical protein
LGAGIATGAAYTLHRTVTPRALAWYESLTSRRREAAQAAADRERALASALQGVAAGQTELRQAVSGLAGALDTLKEQQHEQMERLATISSTPASAAWAGGGEGGRVGSSSASPPAAARDPQLSAELADLRGQLARLRASVTDIMQEQEQQQAIAKYGAGVAGGAGAGAAGGSGSLLGGSRPPLHAPFSGFGDGPSSGGAGDAARGLSAYSGACSSGFFFLHSFSKLQRTPCSRSPAPPPKTQKHKNSRRPRRRRCYDHHHRPSTALLQQADNGHQFRPLAPGQRQRQRQRQRRRT